MSRGCGYHNDIPGGFDYTCDDCMLPLNHYDPPEINDLNDYTDNQKGNEPDTSGTENIQKPF